MISCVWVLLHFYILTIWLETGNICAIFSKDNDHCSEDVAALPQAPLLRFVSFFPSLSSIERCLFPEVRSYQVGAISAH